MTVNDQYARYYTEKLWAMIPEIYHTEDAFAPQPDVLRQIVEVIADQAAITRRSIDRLWEDQNIETCDDWAVPYIADLVGTRLLPETDSRSRRVDVARTVHFRRRRGTPGLLEELVRELSGWDVVLVEAFRRLARAPHRLDSFPLERGRVTGTPTGGTADVRSARGGELAPGPFDEFFRTPDVRQLRGKKGRYAISKLNFHLYRTSALELTSVTPHRFDVGGVITFTVDPSGRDVPLFARSLPVDGDAQNTCSTPWSLLPASGSFVPSSTVCDHRCVVTHEWQLGRPLTCRLLSEASFQFTLAEALSNFPLNGVEENAVRTLQGFVFSSEARLRRRLKDLGVEFAPEPSWYRGFLRLFVTGDSAKPRLAGKEAPGAPQQASITIPLNDAVLEFDQLTGADLSSLDCHPVPSDQAVRELIDPRLGRFAVLDGSTPVVARYFYGYLVGVGAGGYVRELAAPDSPPISTPPFGGPLSALSATGARTLAGSWTYSLRLDSATPIADFTLQADQRARPYLQLESNDPGGAVAVLTPAGPNAKITLDGVWFGSAIDGRQDIVIQSGAPTGDVDWEQITISHATLDPGGKRADGSTIAPLRIVVHARVKLLRIVGSIVGPIEVVLDASPSSSGSIERLEIQDSVVDASQTAPDSLGRRVAISNVVGEVRLTGVTVLGDVRAERIFATNSLVTGAAFALDEQNSCFRFSVASPAEPERRPLSFHAQFFDVPSFFFVSLRFGDPGYAQLSAAAPAALSNGADNGSELGAFSFLRRPIRLSNIAAKVDEFKPVRILPQNIFEGESATVLAAR